MKTLSFALVRRNLGTLALSAVILVAVAYYTFSLLPAKTSRLENRYFRVLARIGLNLNQQLNAQRKAHEGIKWRLRRAPAFAAAARPGKEDWVRDHWKELAPEWPRPVFLSLQPVKAAPAAPPPDLRVAVDINGAALPPAAKAPKAAPAPGLDVREGQLVVPDTLRLGAGRPVTYRLQWSVPFDSVVGPLVRADVFDCFFVLDARRRRLVYSSGAAVAVLDTAAVRRGLWQVDSSGLYTGTSSLLRLQGRDHRLFVTPLRLAGGGTWLLCGAVPAASFDAERQAVSGWAVELGLLLLVLGLLSVPFLKIAFMGPQERLNRIDILQLGVALVLGSGLLLVGLQTLAVRHWLENEVTRRQLRDLSDDINQRLGTEINQLSSLLRRADAGLTAHLGLVVSAATLPYLDLNTAFAARLVGLTKADRQQLSQQPDSSDALVWLNGNGRARLIMGSRPADYLPSLAGRDYFRAISTYPARNGAADARPAATFLASVVSYRNAQRTAVLARRSRWADPVRPGQPNRAAVCIVSTDFRCLRRAVLPPGFSFCVIDQRGEVLFHANPRLNLSENLLDDCQPAGGLRAALFTRGAQAVEAHYQGRESRLWVRPLGVAQPGLFLVTIADGEYLRDWQLRTGLATLRLLGAFWLLLLTLALAWRLLARRLALSSRIRQSFPRLWPRPSFAGQYWLIALAHLAGVALLYPFGVRLSPLGQAVGLLLLPLWLFALTVGLLRVKADGPVRYQHSWLVLGGAVLTLNGLVAYYSYENEKGLWCENDFWKLLGFQLALGAVLGLVAWLRPPREGDAPAVPAAMPAAAPALLSWLVDLLRSLGQGRPGWVSGLVRHDEPLRQTYRPAFSAVVLAWIAVLGVVPAVYCYQLANLAERSVQLRQAHLAVLRQAEAAWARRLAPNGGASDTLDQRSHYLHFYAQTRWVKPEPAADLSKQQDLRRVRANRRFYQWLHRDLDDENRSRLLPTSSERVLPDAAPTADSGAVGSGASTYDDPVGYWKSTLGRRILAPGAAFTRYFSQTPALPRALQSETDALVSGHGLFFATGAPSVQWLRPGYGLLPLGLLLLLGLLAALVHYLARECFLPASDAYRYPLLPPAVARGAAPWSTIHRFLISPAGATLETLPGTPGARLRCSLQAGRLARISTRDLAGAAAGQWEDWLQRKIRTQGNPQRVVLEEVDLYPEDADVTERKRRAVELLLGQGKQVVLLSRCHPLAFVKCEHPLEPLCEVPSHVRQREAGGALLDALAGFRAEYLPLHGPPVLSAGPPPDLSADQEEALRRECDGLPFLHEQRDYLKALVRAGQQRGQHPHAEHVVDLVRRLAQFHYRSLWRRLGPEEQFYLYDLAQDGLVNPHNRHVMETLVQKGFLRYNRHGRLLLCNDSFRQFALSAVPQRQVAAYEQRQRRRSTWAAWQLPLLLLLSSGLLFVFVTQRAAMSGAEQLLTAFVTLLPLLGRLLASFGSLGPSKGEIRT